ncbi:MAG TPA: DUF6049 family protein, partial [Acidimicrobiia bacterium]|nr:DUF6049 family protein [Acidimicrobiia bacterium]
PGENVQLDLALEGAPEGLEVQVLVHRAVTSRTALSQSLDGRSLGAVEGRLSVPAPDLTVNDAGRRVLLVGVQSPDAATVPPDPGRIVPGRSGVYPTEVELRRGGTVVDRFVTPLVVIADGLTPLTMAWVWRFDATPAHQTDGTIRRTATKALGPSGRLVRTALATATAGDVHLTLAPTPETLEAWDETARQEDHLPGGAPLDGAAAGLAALRRAAGTPGHQVLRSPFVPVDIPGLLDANLAGEVDGEFARGADRQQQVLGAAPGPGALLAPGPLNAAGLARLRQYGAERLVFPPEGLRPRDQRLTPGHPFVVGNKGRPFPAAVSDPDLGRLLDGDDAPALRAARFLAGLSLVALEAPGEARGVVVVTPEEWDPPAPLLDAVLAGLRNNPAVTPATLDEYFATVAPEQRDGQPLVRDPAGGSADPSDGDTVRSLRRKLAAFAGVVESNSAWLEAADRAILLSRATVLAAEDRSERKLSSPAAYLQGADRVVKGITSKVRGPKGQRVTLTSRRASVPISLLNATGRPLQVRVRLESDQLRFPDGSERFLTLAPQNTTERFRVESRSTGAFPLVITVTSPDGALLVNSSELTIRSTVVSGVGAILTTGAGIFLLVWWGNDLRRSRRRRRGRARRRGRIAARAAARALGDAERVAAGAGHH